MIRIHVAIFCVFTVSFLTECSGAQPSDRRQIYTAVDNTVVTIDQVTFQRPCSGTIDTTELSAKSMTVYLSVQHATGRVLLWLEDEHNRPITKTLDHDAVNFGDNQFDLSLVDMDGRPLPSGKYTLRMQAYYDDGTLHGADSCEITYLGPKSDTQPAMSCYED